MCIGINNLILGVKSIRFHSFIHESPVDSTLCPAKNGRLKLGNNRSYMPVLQRLCVLRRSVAGLTYIRFGEFSGALIGPVAEEIDICPRHITKTLSGTVF